MTWRAAAIEDEHCRFANGRLAVQSLAGARRLCAGLSFPSSLYGSGIFVTLSAAIISTRVYHGGVALWPIRGYL